MSEAPSDPVRDIILEACDEVSGICGECCNRPNDTTDFGLEDIDPPLDSEIGPVVEHPEVDLRKEIENWLDFQADIDWDVPQIADCLTVLYLDAFMKTGAVLYEMTEAVWARITDHRFGTVPLYLVRYHGVKDYWAVLVFYWGD